MAKAKTRLKKEQVLSFVGEEQFIVPNKRAVIQGTLNGDVMVNNQGNFVNLVDSGVKRYIDDEGLSRVPSADEDTLLPNQPISQPPTPAPAPIEPAPILPSEPIGVAPIEEPIGGSRISPISTPTPIVEPVFPILQPSEPISVAPVPTLPTEPVAPTPIQQPIVSPIGQAKGDIPINEPIMPRQSEPILAPVPELPIEQPSEPILEPIKRERPAPIEGKSVLPSRQPIEQVVEEPILAPVGVTPITSAPVPPPATPSAAKSAPATAPATPTTTFAPVFAGGGGFGAAPSGGAKEKQKRGINWLLILAIAAGVYLVTRKSEK